MKIIFLFVVLFLVAKVKKIAVNRVTIFSILGILALILILALIFYPPAFWFLIK